MSDQCAQMSSPNKGCGRKGARRNTKPLETANNQELEKPKKKKKSSRRKKLVHIKQRGLHKPKDEASGYGPPPVGVRDPALAECIFFLTKRCVSNFTLCYY